MRAAISFFAACTLAAQDTGSVDLGYRWNSDLRGSLDTYRSIVNLGEGPRVLGFHYDAGSKLHVAAGGWGGDPAAWFRLDAANAKWGRVRVDHRDTAYFNAMPSFANPLLDRGIFLNQRAFDSRRRYSDIEVEFGPRRAWKPYMGWTRDSGDGRGVTTFVSDANEYAVANTLDDRTNALRGGIEYTHTKGHLLFEQGGYFFSDDQRVFTADRNLGNRRTPLLGRTLFLADLLQTYNVDGRNNYSKAAASWQPADWIDVGGNWIYGRPSNDIRYEQTNRGLFVDLSKLLFADQQSLRWIAAAQRPHTSGTFRAELRPVNKLRIVETLYADRFVWNQQQQQLDAIADPAKWLTVRGGHRYTWATGAGELKRHTWSAGATVRPHARLSLFGDVESARASKILFRSSLGDADKLRLRARYQAMANLALQFNFGLLDNKNPPQLGAFELKQHQSSAAITWAPRGGGRFRLTGDYARYATRSNLDYTIPELRQPGLSTFRENAHSLSALADIGLPHSATLSLGGSSYISSGSRPAHLYQPQLRASIPTRKNMHLLAEYRWFGFSQPFYLYESFRSHQFLLGMKLLR